MSTSYVPLTDYAARHASSVGSLFRNTHSDGHYLYQYMEVNHWFGLPHQGNGLETKVRFPAHFPEMDLWLKAYGRSDSEKYDILCQALPEANILAMHWPEYVQRHPEISMRSRLDCLDYFASQKNSDPGTWSRDQMEAFILQAISELTQAGAKYVLDYILEQTANNPSLQNSSYTYQLVPHGITRPTHALPAEDYANLAWLVLSEEAAAEGHYIEKAAQNRLAAEMWLMVSLHFVCALRIPDLCRLPVPETSLYATTLRDRVLNGDFSIGECTDFVNSWLTRITLEGITPSKTRRFTGVAAVSVSVPSCLYPMFGKILALAVSHLEPGEPLLSHAYITVRQATAFFGEGFRKYCGSGFFLSTRRMNKSYLQGVEHHADSQGNVNIKGYMLASVLRSHKVHYGAISETTDAYLNDGDFVGVSPEIVAAEMFDRGIFGFIPCLLLSQYDSEWHSLSLHDQTTVIQSLGIAPAGIERLATQLGHAHAAVKEVLASGFRAKDSECNAVKALLERISRDQAPGKSPSNMCLRSAAELPCVSPEASSCMACSYALWTRVGIHVLLEEFERNLREARAVVGVERLRLIRINEDYIMPAVQEILVSIRSIAGGSDAGKGFLEMIQRRIAHAKNS